MTSLTRRTLRGALGGALALFLALLGAAPASAQDATVSGTVVSVDNGEPLLGAAIQVVGTSLGTTTDIDGTYSLTVPPGTYTLRASYTGYEAQEIEVSPGPGQSLVQSFSLEPDLTGLDEVVVTGALSERSISRSEVAVSRIDAAALNDVQEYGDISQLLNGKVAGVSI